MVLENSEFLKYDSSIIVMSAFNTAWHLMKNKFRDEKFYHALTMEAISLTETDKKIEGIEFLSKVMIDFYWKFDNWHCGLN